MAAGGNRNVLNREVGVDGRRDWSFGLCDFTDECGLCMSTALAKISYNLAESLSLEGCWAAWCPCVVYSKNKQRLEHLQNYGTPLPGGGERYNDDCTIHGLLALTGYAWVLQVCGFSAWAQVEALNQTV